MNEEFIKEIITATISGESHLGTNLKTQCLMYFDNLISENKQLKEQLQQKEELINKLKNQPTNFSYDKKENKYDKL